jgi:hypothetical protein
VKLVAGMRGIVIATLMCTFAAFAGDTLGDKPNDKDKKDKAKAATVQVDSGTFGVFIKGQRVVSETFSVQQENGNSSIRSGLKEAAGQSATDQKSNLEITPSGEMLRYEWSQTTPVATSLVVLPNNEFLIEKITTAASAKPEEHPFLMPNTSLILDNNFFIHREVLVWRYLHDDCKPEGAGLKCQKEPAEFGVLVPQDRTSMRIRIQLVDKDKITIHGVERALLRLKLSGEAFEWNLWVDDSDQFKLMRVEIPADNTDVVRD